jgi:uncharacterized iron-regulated membrane protein
MTRRTWAIGVVVVLSACGGGAASSSGGTTSTGGTAAAAPIRLVDALDRAEAHLPSTQPFEVEYEEHEGRRVIEVEVISGETVHAVFYDPATGEIVDEADETPEADEAAALPALRDQIAAGTLSLRRALELATSSYDVASVEAVELVIENGAGAASVLVREEAGMTRYLHEPTTGAVISSGPGTAEHGE